MPLLVAGEDARLRPSRTRSVENRTGQPAIRLRIGFGSRQLLQNDVAVRPGQIEDAIGKRGIVILLRECIDAGPRFGDPGHDIDLYRFLRFQEHRLPDADDRVEHRPRRIRQRRTTLEGSRGGERPMPPDEPKPIGLVGNPAGRGTAHRHHVHHPWRLFFGRPRSSRAVDGMTAADEFRLNEQIAEGRMRFVLRLRGEYDLRVARHFNRPRSVGTVAQGDATQLDVVFWRDTDLRIRFDLVIGPTKLDTCLGENRFVRLRNRRRRLPRVRPDPAVVEVAEIAETTECVAGGIFAPACHRQITPATGTATRACHRDVVVAIGKNMRLDGSTIWVGAHPHTTGLFRRGRSLGSRLAGMGEDRRDQLRHRLLQQRISRSHHRISQEAPLHRLVEQHIRERKQGHPFVMRHELPHRNASASRRQTGRRVVDRLIQAVRPLLAVRRESLQVAAGCFRFDHQRQRTCIGGDDQVLSQAAFQTEAGNTKGPVLVISLQIDRVVARLGNAPGHAPLSAVLDLPAYDCPTGAVEQRIVVAGHHQQRHQILEHRAAPAEQGRPASGTRQQASQGKPVLLSEMTLRDHDEAGQPRLRGEQVVVARITPLFADVVTDGEKVPLTVVEQSEIHVRKLAALEGDPFETLDSCHSPFGCLNQSGLESQQPVACLRSILQEPVQERQRRRPDLRDVSQCRCAVEVAEHFPKLFSSRQRVFWTGCPERLRHGWHVDPGSQMP